MISVEVLVDKLNGFNTPCDIAEFLTEQRVTGCQGCASTCVISNWITVESGETNITTSNAVKVWMYDPEMVFERSKVTYPVSPTVLDFIKLFDQGKYPHLVY